MIGEGALVGCDRGDRKNKNRDGGQTAGGRRRVFYSGQSGERLARSDGAAKPKGAAHRRNLDFGNKWSCLYVREKHIPSCCNGIQRSKRMSRLDSCY
jgi:hypothetical protein